MDVSPRLLRYYPEITMILDLYYPKNILKLCKDDPLITPRLPRDYPQDYPEITLRFPKITVSLKRPTFTSRSLQVPM